MRRHQGAKVQHFDVSNVIYHKFSHGVVSYTLSGKNVNVMLELSTTLFAGSTVVTAERLVVIAITFVHRQINVVS